MNTESTDRTSADQTSTDRSSTDSSSTDSQPTDVKPPSRPPLVDDPRMTQSAEFWFTPVDAATKWFEQYGSAFSFHPIASEPIDFLADPKHIKALIKQEKHFDTGAGNAVLGGFDSVFGRRSLVVLDGDQHKAIRDWVTDAIQVKDGSPVLNGLNAARADVSELLSTWEPQVPIALYKEMRTIATRMMCRVVLGLEGERMTRLAAELAELLETAITPQNWLIHHKEKLTVIDELLYEVIAERIEHPRVGEDEDVISRLITTRGDRTTEDIHDTLLTLVVLGHEGASATLSWALYHLADSAGYAYVEADVKKLGQLETVSVSDLSAVKKLDNALKETLRLRSPLIAVQRMAKCPVDLADVEVPKGQIVCPSMYLIQRTEGKRMVEVDGKDECVPVFEDPELFKIDRFAKLKAEEYQYMFLPFGVGSRSCPGRMVGYAEMKILLSEILYRFQDRLRPAHGYKPDTCRRGNLLTPLDDMPFVLTP